MAAVIESLLGPDPIYDHHYAHVIAPRNEWSQPWHADAILDPRRAAFDIQLCFFFHDTPREMGGTMYLPGSHLRRVNEFAIARYQNFTAQPIPVAAPGSEQKSQWLQIRQQKPDYVLLWGWGVMNSAAVTEAGNVNYPREKMLGVWWSGAEPDVVPAGEKGAGYKALMLQHRAGKSGGLCRPREVVITPRASRSPSPTRSARCSTTAA